MAAFTSRRGSANPNPVLAVLRAGMTFSLRKRDKRRMSMWHSRVRRWAWYTTDPETEPRNWSLEHRSHATRVIVRLLNFYDIKENS